MTEFDDALSAYYKGWAMQSRLERAAKLIEQSSELQGKEDIVVAGELNDIGEECMSRASKGETKLALMCGEKGYV